MLPLSLFAQLQDERHNLSVGINGGVNLNSVSFTPSIKQTNFIAPEFGLTVRYISEKYFKMICGIQGEINFSQRGWKEVIEDGSNNTYHRAMNYIEVPLLAHLAFGKDKGNGARFIINLAWGGDWGGMKGVDESALPVQMEVDYVRVFQKNKA